jgi:hypothetical protein
LNFWGKVEIEDLEVSYQSARWERLRWVLQMREIGALFLVECSKGTFLYKIRNESGGGLFCCETIMMGHESF